MAIRRTQATAVITPEAAGEHWVKVHEIIQKLEGMLDAGEREPTLSAAATHLVTCTDKDGQVHSQVCSYSIPRKKECRYINGIVKAIEDKYPRWLLSVTVVHQRNGVDMVTLTLQHAN